MGVLQTSSVSPLDIVDEKPAKVDDMDIGDHDKVEEEEEIPVETTAPATVEPTQEQVIKPVEDSKPPVVDKEVPVPEPQSSETPKKDQVTFDFEDN